MLCSLQNYFIVKQKTNTSCVYANSLRYDSFMNAFHYSIRRMVNRQWYFVVIVYLLSFFKSMECEHGIFWFFFFSFHGL